MKPRVCGFCELPWHGGLGFQKDGVDLKFCGRACFQFWKHDMKLNEQEVEAIQHMIPAMAQYVMENDLGGKSFNDFTKDEICALFANTLKQFRYSFNICADVPF